MQSMRRNRAVGWLVGLSLALTLAACGAPADDEPDTQVQEPGETADADADADADVDADVEDAAAPAGEDEIVIGIRQVGEVFDPTTVLPAEISAVFLNVNERLWYRDFDGELVPGLVEEWTVSDDGLTIDAQLREGVTFHSGHEFTAEDVAFSWRRHDDAGFGARVARTLEEVEVVDTHHVRFSFESAELGFLAGSGFPIVSAQYHEEVGDDEFLANPVGTGPYRFTDFSPGEYVDLEAFADYWGEAPQVQRARMRFVTEDTTRMAQLRAGEIDMAMQVPFVMVDEISGTDGLTTVELSPGGTSTFIAMKTDDPESPWADDRVREAITLAIDHQAIVEDAFNGVPTSHPFLAPDDLGYDPELPHYDYDPERARELLEEAGYGDGLEFELPYIAGAAAGVQETAEAVSLYLNEVGIRATPRALEGPSFVGFVMQASGNPDMDFVAVFIGALGAGMFEPTVGMVTQLSQASAFAWYVNPQVNGMVMQAATTWDSQERAEMIRQIGRLVHEDRRLYPLWTSTDVYGMRDCIEFTPRPTDLQQLLLKDVDMSAC